MTPLEFVLIFTLLNPPVIMPLPYPTEQACHAAGEAAAPSCSSPSDSWVRTCRPVTHICVPVPAKE